jgi:hypothetical protein
MVCYGLDQDRNQRRALVNTMMNFRVLEWLNNWQGLKKGSAP